MINLWQRRFGILLLSAPLLLCTTTCLATEKPSPAPAKDEAAIEPEAMAALDAMGKYLHTLAGFVVTSEMSMDEVLLNGQKILVTGTTQFTTKIPNRMHVASKITEIGRDNEYFYDGKTFTIFSKPDQFFATFDAPDTIGKLLDVAQYRYNVEIPLRDLFYWGTEKARTKDIQAAYFIGDSLVAETPCKHYAFRQEDVDWQIWIEADDTPLPRRLAITSKLEKGQPQYISTLSWNVTPKLTESTFTFTPPEGVYEIEFAVYDDSNAKDSKQ